MNLIRCFSDKIISYWKFRQKIKFSEFFSHNWHQNFVFLFNINPFLNSTRAISIICFWVNIIKKFNLYVDDTTTSMSNLLRLNSNNKNFFLCFSCQLILFYSSFFLNDKCPFKTLFKITCFYTRVFKFIAAFFACLNITKALVVFTKAANISELWTVIAAFCTSCKH